METGVGEKLRNWYIFIIAAMAIVGGLYLASSSMHAAQEAANQAFLSAPPRAAQPETTSAAPEAAPEATAEAAPEAAPEPPASTEVATAEPAPAVEAPAAAPPAASAEAPAAAEPAMDHAHHMAAAETAEAPAGSAAPPEAPAAAAPAPAAPPPPAANATAIAHGEQVYKKCRACHSLEPGRNLLGPSLADVVGRPAGTETGYSYSQAMKESGLVWDVATLDQYLAAPQKFLPGNKMPFPGLKSDHDREDVITFLASLAVPAAAAAAPAATPAAPAGTAAATPPAAAETLPQPAGAATPSPAVDVTYLPDAKYTLRSGIAEGRMVFIGVGGAIDGQVNPLLTAVEGQVVQVTLINGEGAAHDIVFPDQNANSPRVTGKGASTTIAFRASAAGDFVYYCSVPGHRAAGMEGQFLVTAHSPEQTVVEAYI